MHALLVTTGAQMVAIVHLKYLSRLSMLFLRAVLLMQLTIAVVVHCCMPSVIAHCIHQTAVKHGINALTLTIYCD
jgi:hypothetical protein